MKKPDLDNYDNLEIKNVNFWNFIGQPQSIYLLNEIEEIKNDKKRDKRAKKKRKKGGK